MYLLLLKYSLSPCWSCWWLLNSLKIISAYCENQRIQIFSAISVCVQKFNSRVQNVIGHHLRGLWTYILFHPCNVMHLIIGVWKEFSHKTCHQMTIMARVKSDKKMQNFFSFFFFAHWQTTMESMTWSCGDMVVQKLEFIIAIKIWAT